MNEISLEILDIIENSIRANATKVEVTILEDKIDNLLKITISDNGDGMSEEQLLLAQTSSFSTKACANCGKGIINFKADALKSDGDFKINSQIHIGTTITVTFVFNHKNRKPLGNIPLTFQTIFLLNPTIQFILNYSTSDGFITENSKNYADNFSSNKINIIEASKLFEKSIREQLLKINASLWQ